MDMFPIKPAIEKVGVPDRFEAARLDGATVLVIAIPFEMLEPHDAQAMANHNRSLRRLQIEGGLTPGEILAILDHRRVEPSHSPDAHRKLARRLFDWQTERARNVPAFTSMEGVGPIAARPIVGKPV